MVLGLLSSLHKTLQHASKQNKHIRSCLFSLQRWVSYEHICSWYSFVFSLTLMCPCCSLSLLQLVFLVFFFSFHATCCPPLAALAQHKQWCDHGHFLWPWSSHYNNHASKRLPSFSSVQIFVWFWFSGGPSLPFAIWKRSIPFGETFFPSCGDSAELHVILQYIKCVWDDNNIECQCVSII